MKTDNGLAAVKIFKFDPSFDSEPRYDNYEVPYKGSSVLDVLNYVYEHYDPGLSYRFGCKVGFCGGCPIMVNGKPAFSCQKVAEKEMTIEPHSKFEVIKDLVVDFDRLRE